MTTAYSDALKRSLLEGLILLEGAVTQPVGLTYDLRAARAAFMSATGLSADGVDTEGEEPIGGRPVRRGRVDVPVEQALENLEVTRRTLNLLVERKAVDPGWADRTRKVLARVEQRLGAQLRQPIAAKVRGL